MTSVTATPVADDFTVHDLDAMPDDGQRYELADGFLLVSPAPSEAHQRAAGELFHLLRLRVPPELRVYMAPLDVRFSRREQVQPDVLVAPQQQPGARLKNLPVLCVEVLSPSTRRHDLVHKRRALQRAGIPLYWIVDPLEPSLTVLELMDGEYHEVAHVEDDQPYDAERPFPVRVVPAALLD